MATYISLLSFRQQGVENIKESPARLDAAKQAFQAMGAELKEFYLVMGQRNENCLTYQQGKGSFDYIWTFFFTC